VISSARQYREVDEFDSGNCGVYTEGEETTAADHSEEIRQLTSDPLSSAEHAVDERTKEKTRERDFSETPVLNPVLISLNGKRFRAVNMPCNKEKGDAGEPGTKTSTGSVPATPPREA
jgi:hypothetical protein